LPAIKIRIFRQPSHRYRRNILLRVATIATRSPGCTNTNPICLCGVHVVFNIATVGIDYQSTWSRDHSCREKMHGSCGLSRTMPTMEIGLWDLYMKTRLVVPNNHFRS
jgi:hypothetical protein